MKKTVILLGILTVAAWFAGGAAYGANLVVNPDFSDGLNDWIANENVFESGQVAYLVDGIPGIPGGPDAMLLQIVATPESGQYCIDFDFLGELSDAVDPFAFFDTFFASLYFSDDGSTPVAALDLFDMDFSGVSNNQGTITPNGNMQHFHMSFINDYAYVAPSFDLAGLNGFLGDSRVLVDNVNIRLCDIPEPTTLLLLGAGLLAGALRKALAK